jgi:hypothetical protein
MISEKLNTKSRINRWLSITVSAVIRVRNTGNQGTGSNPPGCHG